MVRLDPDAAGRGWAGRVGGRTAELPADLPATAVAARARGRAVARSAWELGWEYTVLDVPGLRGHLDAALDDVTVVPGRVVHRDDDGVALADGTRVRARAVVDAGGYRQPLLARAGGHRWAALKGGSGRCRRDGT